MNASYSSPYVLQSPPSSKLIHKLLDEAEENYQYKDNGKFNSSHSSYFQYELMYKNKYNRKKGSNKTSLPKLIKSQNTRASENIYNQPPNEFRCLFSRKELHHFYNRHVFQLAPPLPVESPPATCTPDIRETRDEPLDQIKQFHQEGHPDDDVSDDVLHTLVSDQSLEIGEKRYNPGSLLSSIVWPTQDTYDTCFEHDWTKAKLEVTVKDAVERRRIYTFMKKHYKMLLSTFMYYAAVAGAQTWDPFRLTSKVKLCEDLHIPMTDPAKFDISDAGTLRYGIINVSVNIARMVLGKELTPSGNALAEEGIDLSQSVHRLLHDNFLTFSHYTDVNDARREYFSNENIDAVFLSKQDVLTDAFNENVENSTDNRNKQTMSFSWLMNLLYNKKMFTEGLNEVHAAYAFAQSTPIIADYTEGELNFAQFLEFLCRITLLKNEDYINTGKERDLFEKDIIEEGFSHAQEIFRKCLIDTIDKLTKHVPKKFSRSMGKRGTRYKNL